MGINWPTPPNSSKYERIYLELIEKVKSRKIPKSEYKEVHHIIPRCMGGSDSKENLVDLTAREHYIAHALLWKMKFSGIYGSKMAFAFNTFIRKMVTTERGIHHTYKITSRIYEGFKKDYARIMREKLKGVKRDPDIIEKCAKHKRGKKWEEIYDYETIQKMLTAIQTRILPPESIDKIAAGRLKGAAAPMPEHVKKQVGNRFRGRTDLIGENNGMYGKKHSKESIEKGKEVKRRNREAKIASGWIDPRKGVYTEHQQTILKKAKEAQMVRVSCLYCRTEANLSNHKRWHAENCKMKN
jgi:hypothetical protein